MPSRTGDRHERAIVALLAAQRLIQRLWQGIGSRDSQYEIFLVLDALEIYLWLARRRYCSAMESILSSICRSRSRTAMHVPRVVCIPSVRAWVSLSEMTEVRKRGPSTAAASRGATSLASLPPQTVMAMSGRRDRRAMAAVLGVGPYPYVGRPNAPGQLPSLRRAFFLRDFRDWNYTKKRRAGPASGAWRVVRNGQCCARCSRTLQFYAAEARHLSVMKGPRPETPARRGSLLASGWAT